MRPSRAAARTVVEGGVPAAGVSTSPNASTPDVVPVEITFGRR
jgi:hypothetical protein